MSGVIYRIVCTPSGKSYIGQTISSLEHRFAQHMNGKRYALGGAVQKYGRDAFRVEVLERCESVADLDAAERFWIDWYETLSPRGYNLTSGGQAFRHNASSREKISAAHKGKPRHANTRAAVSVANARRVVSAETRRRMSEAHLGHADRLRKAGAAL
jgi:group I intron endonuclease